MIANGQQISTGLFLRALKKLNSKLRVCSFENSNRLAGLYLINKRDEWEDICGVDKNYIPAYATFDDGGHIIKSGWRRVFWILLAQGYVSHQDIRKVCRGFFDYRACAADRFVGGIAGDPIGNTIMKYMLENSFDPMNPESELLTPDQLLHVGSMIHSKDSEAQRAEREHDVWFLKKWKTNGGGINDRPNY